MNQSFYRKIGYLLALVLLLWPMSWLGAPSTRGGPGMPDNPGGKLAQLRTEAMLGQAEIGQIDPASETIRMATLGLRGMAVTMLWNKANEYKKVEDWTAFRATLEQLARLQPYFVKVWQYQAWNLTYNVSVELDNFRDRFYYVKQGIQYLKSGIVYLRDNPTLLDDLGWFCGNKVGRADEHFWYRQMFKADEDLHAADTPMANRDNWLVSKEWYELAISAIDDKKKPLGTKNPVTFFDSPARSQMSYAEAIQEEGTLVSQWKSAWQEGARLWRDYANRDMPSTEGFLVRMGDQEKYEADVQEYIKKLDELSPGLTEKMKVEAEAALTAEQKRLVIAMPAEPTEEESKLQQEALAALDITPFEVASRIAKDDAGKASEARKLATQVDEANRRIRSISTDRDVANFEYWRLRCEIEQTDDALRARELALEAKREFQDEANLEKARALYEQSFVLWARALDAFPGLTPDSTMGSDLMEFVDEDAQVLTQLDLSLADKEVGDQFALWRVVEANDSERKYADAIVARQERVTGVKPGGADAAINPADGLID